MLRRYSSIIISLLLLTAVTGCRSSKPSTTPTTAETTTEKAAETSFKEMLASYGGWEEMSAPMTVALRKPASFKISGTLTMKRGEYIHYSARIFGMEVGSLMITRDSVFAREKLHKRYVAESIRDLTGSFPATIDDLQQMLMGHIFVLGENDPKKAARSCDFETYPGFWTATATCRPGNQTYTFTVDTSTGLLKMLSAELRDKYPVTACYSDFADTRAGKSASTVDLEASTSKTAFEAGFTVNYSKSRWESVSHKTWETPRGYTRIAASALLKSLSKL